MTKANNYFAGVLFYKTRHTLGEKVYKNLILRLMRRDLKYRIKKCLMVSQQSPILIIAYEITLRDARAHHLYSAKPLKYIDFMSMMVINYMITKMIIIHVTSCLSCIISKFQQQPFGYNT